MRKAYVLTATLVVALLPAATGCRLHDVEREVPPPVQVPEAFSQSGAASAGHPWWTDFEDPTLAELIELALSDNLDIRRAWARLDQARALAVQSGAELYPTLGATGSASRTRLDTPGTGGTVTTRTNTFSMGLLAGYEVDLWGRVRSARDAAAADADASEADLQAAAITVAAAVGDVWYAIAEQQAQRALLGEQVEVSRTFLELTELRFGQGQGSALDVYQQRTQLTSTTGQIPLVESRLAVLQHQLAVLLGRPPKAELPLAEALLPGLPPLPATGVPAELLARRPDVRAAQLRVNAADYRLGVAIANLLPALSLSATGSYSGEQIGDIFDMRMWSIAGEVFGPIFEGHRRTAEVERTRAVVADVLAGYGQTVLAAFREVEDALAQERQQVAFLASLGKQVDLAGSTLREARLQYANGLGDYLNVLTALATLQRLQRDQLTARQQLIAFRIQLYRALAGTWPREIARPEPTQTGDTI